MAIMITSWSLHYHFMITSWSLHDHFMIPFANSTDFLVPPGVCNRILLWFQPVNPGCVLLHLGVCRWGSILPSNLQFFELAAQSRKYTAQRLVQHMPPLHSANEPNIAKPMNDIFRSTKALSNLTQGLLPSQIMFPSHSNIASLNSKSHLSKD